MLEQLRQNSRSFIIWILFAIIILAFVFTFGSQGGLQFDGCGGAGSNWVIQVQGKEVSEHSWRFGRNTFGRALQQNPQRRMTEEQMHNAILDRLLAREILAQAAAAEGLETTADLIVQEYLARGKFWTLGEYNDLLDTFVLQFSNQGTGFMVKRFDNSVQPPEEHWMLDEKLLEATVHSWGLPNIDMFIDEQKREVLAALMRRTIRASAVASDAEARLLFEQENTKASLEAVVFRAFDYREKLRYSEADVAAYLARNEAAVRKRYDENERLYKERKPQIRIREMVFETPEEEPEETPAGADDEAGAGAGDEAGAGDAAAGADAKPSGPTGREAADAAYQRLQAGADFAQLAAEVSQDVRTQRNGGDLGWRSAELPGMGAPELTEAVKALTPGSYSEVIEAGDRFYIVYVQSKRDGGDLSFDDVKLEIAEPMMLEEYSKAMARRAAEDTLAQVKAGAELDDLFEDAPAAPAMPPGLTPEMLQDLPPGALEELLRRQGRITVETREFQAQGTPAAPPAAPPDNAAAPADNAAAPADDAAAPADAAAAGAPADAGSDAVPLALPDDVPAPRLQTIGPFPRDVDGEIPGIGKAPTLMSAAFDQLETGQLFGEVVEVNNKYVVARLTERSMPKEEEFDERTREDLKARISASRASDAIADWLNSRCQALTSGGKVSVNNARLEALMGQPEDAPPFQYRACGYLYSR